MNYVGLQSQIIRKVMLMATTTWLVWSASPIAFAQVGPTGNQLLEECVSKLIIPRTHCLGFIAGIAEGHFLSAGTGNRIFCFPANANIDQTRKIVVRYLKKHARLLDRNAGELVLRALSDAWPCIQ